MPLNPTLPVPLMVINAIGMSSLSASVSTFSCMDYVMS